MFLALRWTTGWRRFSNGALRRCAAIAALVACAWVAATLVAPPGNAMARGRRAHAAGAFEWHGAGGSTGCLVRGASPPPRPGLPDTLGSVHVLAHFDRSVVDSAYVHAVLEGAERTHRVLVDTLGFRAPDPDGAGGDDRIDVYVGPIGGMPAGVAGVTWPENPTGDPVYPASSTAWFQVTVGLPDSVTGVVAAHEYFHVIQLGYDRDENNSLLEMLSTWGEERVFPDADLYIRRLKWFFDQPEQPLFSFTYSNVPWLFFLTQRYGDGVLVDLMDAAGRTPGNPPGALRAAHDAALAAHGGGDFFAELVTFRVWNLFTGARDDGAHYREGARWPEVRVETRIACIPQATLVGDVRRAGSYGATVHVIEGDHAHGALRIPVRPDWTCRVDASVTTFTPAGATTTAITWPQYSTFGDTIVVPGGERVDSVIVVASNFRGSGSSSQAAFSIGALHARPAPPAAAWVLVLDRDACRRPFDGLDGRLAPTAGQERAFARALADLGVDFLQTDSIPADLSACRGVIVCGGQDDAGLVLDDAELDRLTAFVDAGGDVYLESRAFGRFADVPAASASARAFWTRFGASWRAGDSLAAHAWSTRPGPLGVHAMAYGGVLAQGAGELALAGADSLIVDDRGRLRGTVLQAGSSCRIHATLLLGASGDDASRAAWMASVLSAWDAGMPVLGVRTATLAANPDGVVTLEAVVGGWSGQTLGVVRDPGAREKEVDATVTAGPDGARVRAADAPGAGRHAYVVRLVERGAAVRDLWQGEVTVAGTRPPLWLGAVSPNPARDRVALDVRSPGGVLGVDVFDVAGRRVGRWRLALPAGQSRVELDLARSRRLGSGVYFVRVRDATGHVARRKFLVMR